MTAAMKFDAPGWQGMGAAMSAAMKFDGEALFDRRCDRLRNADGPLPPKFILPLGERGELWDGEGPLVLLQAEGAER